MESLEGNLESVHVAKKVVRSESRRLVGFTGKKWMSRVSDMRDWLALSTFGVWVAPRRCWDYYTMEFVPLGISTSGPN
jgi:hypothetical protein